MPVFEKSQRKAPSHRKTPFFVTFFTRERTTFEMGRGTHSKLVAWLLLLDSLENRVSHYIPIS